MSAICHRRSRDSDAINTDGNISYGFELCPYVCYFINISNQPVGCHAPCHADGEIEALEN